MEFTYIPKGPFDLFNQNNYFGGWPFLTEDKKSIVITFPIEGWKESVSVVVEQLEDKSIRGNVYGCKNDAGKAWFQALASLSLDVDATNWPLIGKKDEVIAELQAKYNYLRPVLFHSPYEAAASFIIGHRISMKQGRSIKQNMARDFGSKIEIGTESFYAFPQPNSLLKITEYPGLSSEKIVRLHKVAQSAIDGWLERNYLRSLSFDEASSKIRTIRGVGNFFAQGILFRGAGVVDFVTEDDITPQAVQQLYKIDHLPSRDEILLLAEDWRPFRMWATVLMHIWVRSEGKIIRTMTPYGKKSTK